MALIAILEDDARRTETMRAWIEFSGLQAAFFDNAPEMISWLPENLASVTLISLDHDLGPDRPGPDGDWDPGTGRQVADLLTAFRPQCPVIVHSSNAPAAEGMQFALEGAGWTVLRVFPFHDLEWIASSWLERSARRCRSVDNPRYRPGPACF